MNFKCEECDKEFTSKEAIESHNKSKHPEEVKQPFLTNKSKKKIKYILITAVIVAIILYGFYLLGNQKTLPPTDMVGHIEANPSSHILRKPMQIAIHKHMLEHADAIEGGRGGVIINYDCKNYECAEDLVDKLEQFAVDYDYVYVAPYKNMATKIAVSKLNRQITLEEYDEEAITAFI
jgi:hypothetical protein